MILYAYLPSHYNVNDSDNGKNVIVSSGFNSFNTFINHYDQGFILNNMILYIISSIQTIYLYIHIHIESCIYVFCVESTSISEEEI